MKKLLALLLLIPSISLAAGTTTVPWVRFNKSGVQTPYSLDQVLFGAVATSSNAKVEIQVNSSNDYQIGQLVNVVNNGIGGYGVKATAQSNDSSATVNQVYGLWGKALVDPPSKTGQATGVFGEAHILNGSSNGLAIGTDGAGYSDSGAGVIIGARGVTTGSASGGGYGGYFSNSNPSGDSTGVYGQGVGTTNSYGGSFSSSVLTGDSYGIKVFGQGGSGVTYGTYSEADHITGDSTDSYAGYFINTSSNGANKYGIYSEGPTYSGYFVGPLVSQGNFTVTDTTVNSLVVNSSAYTTTIRGTPSNTYGQVLSIQNAGATTAGGPSALNFYSYAAQGDGSAMSWFRSRGSEGSPANVNSTDQVGQLAFFNYHTGNYRYIAEMLVQPNGTQSATASGGKFIFQVVPTGSLVLNTNDLVIDGSATKIGTKLGLLESTGATYYTYLQAGDQGGDLTYTMPVSVPAGNSLWMNNGSGVTSWTQAYSSSVSNSDGSLTISPTSGAVVASVTAGYVPSALVGKVGEMQNIGFTMTGTGTTTLNITQANGSAFANTNGNRGYVWLRSATDGSIIRGVLTANVSIVLTGAHWGLDTQGDTTNSILRVYAINDGNTANGFTPTWGVGYQGGFQYIRNTQDNTTATSITLPENILVNANVATDNSPMTDVGYILANFDDTGGASENIWAIQNTHPSESADGLWQPWNITYAGFSANPSGGSARWTQVGKTVTVLHGANNGTSNATSFTLSVPVKASVGDNILIHTTDNSANATGRFRTAASSVTVTLDRVLAAAGWTNSGAKNAAFTVSLEAYQP